jgi:hypothetical protein
MKKSKDNIFNKFNFYMLVQKKYLFFLFLYILFEKLHRRSNSEIVIELLELNA